MSIRTEGSYDEDASAAAAAPATTALEKAQRTTAAGSTPAIRPRVAGDAMAAAEAAPEQIVTPHASGVAREPSVLRSCLPTDLLFQFEEASTTRSGKTYSPVASPAGSAHRCFGSPSVVAAAIVRGEAPPPPAYPGSATRMSYRRAMVNSANMAVQKRAAPRRRVPYPDPVGGGDALHTGAEGGRRAVPRYHVQEPRRLEIRTAPRSTTFAATAQTSAHASQSASASRPGSKGAVLRPANGVRRAAAPASKAHNRSVSVDVSDETLDFLGLNRSLFARLQLASPRAGVTYLNGYDNVGSDV